MATLNHEGTISTFYGTVALRQAHAAAVSGDVITLSSGTFLSTDISKAVTIRGAGMDVTKVNDIVNEPTILSGDFKINPTLPFLPRFRFCIRSLTMAICVTVYYRFYLF